jgi:Na+/phosphate symporter
VAVERGYPAAVRDAYQAQLDRLTESLADMCSLVADALDKATHALLQANLRLAEQVIADDTRIDDLRTAAEEQAYSLLALQAPVATDLRIVVSAIHSAGDIERMGDLAQHIRRGGPTSPSRSSDARRNRAVPRRDGPRRQRVGAQGRWGDPNS